MQTDPFEPTIEQMLTEPIVCLLMARDGITADDIRRLMAEMRARLRAPATVATREDAPPPLVPTG